MERQLIIGLIRFQLSDGGWGIENTTFKKVHNSKDLVIRYGTKNQIIIVLYTFSAINHKV